MRILSLIVILILPWSSWAATNTAASTSRADVSTALGLCSNGDTLQIPTGTNSGWSSLLLVNKQVVIRGNGTNSTRIGPYGFSFAIGTSNWRVSQITFDAGGSGDHSAITCPGDNTGNQGTQDWRIDHCLFYNFTDGGFGNNNNSVISMKGYCYGVIDHNEFNTCQGEIIDYCSDGTEAWQRSDVSTNGIGGYTNGTIFVEDNFFISAVGMNNLVEGNQGARTTFRYNRVSAAGIENLIERHGFEVNCNEQFDFASARSVEIYGNWFTNSATSRENGFVKLRGGGALICSNQFFTTGSGDWNNAVRFQNLRSYAYGLPLTVTNSLGQAWEKEAHVDTDTGGPLINEGLVASVLTYGVCNQQVNDVYLWSNTNRTAGAELKTFSVDSGNTRDYQSLDIVEGRNFTNATPSFSYATYTYPHPLVTAQDSGGGDVTAPTCAITSPASVSSGGSGSYSTSSSTITVSGTSDDATATVTWSNSRGGAGTATGSTSWSQAGITLASGGNVLTFTATDPSANFTTTTLNVTYTVPAAGGTTNNVGTLRIY